MALKQLMLRKKIDQRNASLAELLEQEEALKVRSQAAEEALAEAESDEDIATVEEEATAIETEQTEIDERKATLQGEIDALEAELEELKSKAPSTNARGTEPPIEQRQTQQITEVNRMSNNVFRSLPMEQRAALVAREEVKQFLQQARDLAAISQTRAVSGAELTIPDVMLGLIRDNLDRYSKLYKRVNVQPLKGTSRQNIAGAVPEGIWTEACGVLNELSIVFNQIEFDGYKIGGFIPVCNATLEDSDLNLAAEILDAISQAIGLGMDKAILYGTGQKMPVGIATRLAQASQPSNWGQNAPAWVDLRTSNIKKIDPTGKTAEQFFSELILNLGIPRANYANGGLFWAMNRKTYATLMSKLVTFNASGAIVASINNVMPIIGGDIEILDFIADNDIIGGYGSLYKLIERSDIKLARSEHVRFIQDQTVFKGTGRYDGAPVFGQSFVIVNIANTDPTTSAVFAPDTANPEDAYLSALTLGSLTLSPTFNSGVFAYTAATTNATTAINATAAKSGAVITIDHGGDAVTNGGTITWDSGANTVTVTVKNGTTTQVYTVVVTKS